MIRLVAIYGSLERDIDVLIVVDKLDELFNVFESILPLKPLDLHILTTETFNYLIHEDPFYVNVVVNGKILVKNMKVNYRALTDVASCFKAEACQR